MVCCNQSFKSASVTLAAACAAALLLVGCGPSNTYTADQASYQAAQLVQGAGGPRVTDALIDAVMSGSVTGPAGIKSGQIVQNSSDQDYQDAIKKLTGALALEGLSPATKSGLQAQLGATQLMLAQYRFGRLQSDILDLSQQAALIESLAQTASDLNTQANLLEKENKAASSAESDKAKASVAQCQEALTGAQAKVKSLQDQIASKLAEARKIYADTDAAFLAADALKGEAAITAGNKAMTDRAQAEKLTAEAGILGPDLAQAQTQLALAQAALADAQSVAAYTQAAYQQAQATAKQTTARIATLRAAASDLIGTDAADTTLKGRLKQFMAQAAKIDQQVRDAAAAADQADASYAGASQNYNAYVADAAKSAEDAQLDASAPLRRVFKDERPAVILAWSQSAAQQLAGRAYLVGAQASNLISGVTRQASSLKISPGADVALDGTRFREEATKRFTKAATLTDAANKRSPQAGGDVDRIRWIGLSLEATANQGLYALGTNSARQTAVAARDKAITHNPALAPELSWIGR